MGDTCWLKGSQGTPQPGQGMVSGPRNCPDSPTPAPGPCCSQGAVVSSGGSQEYQWTRLGHYTLLGSQEGRSYYGQVEGGSNYLYYLSSIGVWYVNDGLMVNMGGLINWGDAVCPEDIQEPWSYYQWGDGTSNDWEVDSTLRVNCESYTAP